MTRATLARLTRWIPRFRRTRLLVVGDAILDEFLWGSVSRISPEAPVPVVLVNRDSYMPGGAANVANNLRALGGRVAIAGVTGRDEAGQRLRRELRKRGVHVEGLVTDVTRPTSLKTRVVAHSQQVVRIDKEDATVLSRPVRDRLIRWMTRQLPRVDGVIIEDYGKGVIGPEVLEAIVPRARKLKRVVTVDPKEGHFAYYAGVTAITPNRQEAGMAVGVAVTDRRSLHEAGTRLLARLSCHAVLVTLGEEGMCLFESRRAPVHIPTVAQEVFDVAGAGDTVIAAFTLALAAGADLESAAHLANFAAGIVVGKVGVAVVTPQELVHRIRHYGR